MRKLSRSMALSLYHKLKKVTAQLEDIRELYESLGEYDKEFRLHFADKMTEEIYWSIEDMSIKKIDNVMEEIAKAFEFTIDEKIHDPKTLRILKERKESVQSEERAIRYMRKSLNKMIDLEWANDIAKLFGKTLDELGVKKVTTKYGEFIPVVSLAQKLLEK